MAPAPANPPADRQRLAASAVKTWVNGSGIARWVPISNRQGFQGNYWKLQVKIRADEEVLTRIAVNL
jgi:hypothetical protein